jgi:hypothetical protein
MLTVTKAKASLALATLAIVFAPAAATSDEAQKSARQPAPALSGAKVGKDPKTGVLRPLTPAEEAALAKELRKAFARFKPHTRQTQPDGTVSLVVAPLFIRLGLARVGADGSLSWSCTSSPENAARLLEIGATPPVASGEQDR